MNKFGFYTAVLTSLVTLVTFIIAILTPPITGPLCTKSCISYPFLNVASRFPQDYIWMYPAMLFILLYIVFMVCIHTYVSKNKLLSQIGLIFSIISATIFLIDYYTQVTVIQQSLINGETNGISLLTQYNPHGIFIALEEVGYLLMSISFLFMAFVFSKTTKLEKAISLIFNLGFISTIGSFILIGFLYGLKREYRLEITLITINWFVLIINGLLLSKVFRSKVNTSA